MYKNFKIHFKIGMMLLKGSMGGFAFLFLTYMCKIAAIETVIVS